MLVHSLLLFRPFRPQPIYVALFSSKSPGWRYEEGGEKWEINHEQLWPYGTKGGFPMTDIVSRFSWLVKEKMPAVSSVG
jgi:hypothetical protein